MICYRDMTFCVSPNCANKCGRKLTDEIKAEAVKWWGGPSAPIAMSYYCDDEGNLLKCRESPAPPLPQERAEGQ